MGRALSDYVTALTEAMGLCAAAGATFIGQAVRFKGTAMHQTLANVPMDQRIEFPVAEDMQLGVSIGLARAGLLPVSIFPRWSFLVLATNQLVNHLNVYGDKVIVRVGIGSKHPMHPGPQHLGDFTGPFRVLCPNVTFSYLPAAAAVVPAYERALRRDGPTVLVEEMDRYNG